MSDRPRDNSDETWYLVRMRRRRPLLEHPRAPAAQRADSEQIVRAIIAAAIHLGPEATLVDIAARAGVGVASLHRYFPTTAAIFAEVSRETYRTLLEQIRRVTDRTDLDLRSMIHEVCSAVVAGPGLSFEHRRRLNLEIPLIWSMGVAEQVYAEVVDATTVWIRKNVVPPPVDLDARIFIAMGTLRGCTLVGLLYPNLAPSNEVLLPVLVDAVHRIVAGGAPEPPSGAGAQSP